VATGGAPHSIQAVERAISLAVQFSAELHLVAVVSVVSHPLINMGAAVPGSGVMDSMALENTSTIRQAHLLVTAEQARRHGLTVHEHLIQALKPAEAILAVAAEVQADLIVLGRRHKTAFSAALAGSTGDAVSHAAQADVLIAR
jgi:nucleotide-binding universal stress UspA family protein